MLSLLISLALGSENSTIYMTGQRKADVEGKRVKYGAQGRGIILD